MAPGFFSVKSPEWVGATVEVPYHALFLGFSVRAVVMRVTIER
jgi:hypothetical protein